VLKNLAEECQPVPIKGVLNLAKIPFVDPTTVPRIFTRIPDLDNMIGGFGEGTLTILSGKRGQGKSTIGGTFLLNAIEQGVPVCMYSGELNATKVFEWICLQATESKYIEAKVDQRSGKVFGVVPREIQERIRAWIDNKLYLFDNAYVDDCTQSEAIMKVFNFCARRYGCKMFLVDNAMSALVSADEENKAQAKFAASLKNFAVKFKASVLLVAHPRKTKQGEVMQNDDVSGASALTNLADNVFFIERPSVRVQKNRDFGTTGFILCNYDPANHRIFQANIGDKIVYSWDHTGLKLPEDPVCNYPEFAMQLGQPEIVNNYPF
jgi:twinkle protein